MTEFYRRFWGNEALSCKRSLATLGQLLCDPKNFVEQRTPEWYAMREHVLTASNYYDICVTRGNQAATIINEKLFPDQFPRKEFKFSYPLFHGCRCETAAQAFYEWYTGTKLHSFGLVVSKRSSYIASSPDGINNYGIMVEFKCPVSRAIEHGKVPIKYLYQIYGQLYACDLIRCDYVECIFDRAHNAQTWLDSPVTHKTILVFTQDVDKGVTDKDNWVASFDKTAEEQLADATEEIGRRFAIKTANERVVVYHLILSDHNIVKVEYDEKIVSNLVRSVKEVADIMEAQRAAGKPYTGAIPKSSIVVPISK